MKTITALTIKPMLIIYADEPVIVRSMIRRMKKVEKYAGKKGSVLDVGCAAGFSLLAARQTRMGGRGN